MQGLARADVALVSVEQVHAKLEFIRPDCRRVNALLKCVSEDQLAAGRGLGFTSRVVRQFDAHRLVPAGQAHVKWFADADAGSGIGVEPVGGVGDENGKRDAQGPRAVERVEANPHDALAVVFARCHERRGRRLDERCEPRRRLGGERLGHLHVVEIDETQQRVGAFPVHNRRPVDRAAGPKPVGRLRMDRQHVAAWPSAWRDVVEHDKIGRRLRVGEVGRHGEVELGHAAKRPLEELVALRDQQRAGVAPGEAEHRGGVVHGERVVVFQLQPEDAVGALAGDEDERRRVGRANGHAPVADKSPAEKQGHVARERVGEGVGNRRKNCLLPDLLRVRPNFQRHDAEIVAALTHPVIGQVQVLQLEFIQIRRRAVTEQMHLGPGSVAREVLGELDRIEETRRRVGGLSLAKRGAQRRLGAGRRLADLGHRAGQQQNHSVVVVHRVDELGQLGLRLAKPTGRNIGRLHRRRHVENGDDETAALQFAGKVRASQREHGQREQDELDDQQPVVPKFLER